MIKSQSSSTTIAYGQQATSDAPLFAKRYRLGTPLGSGGFGYVYQAVDTRTGNQVAVKMERLPRPMKESPLLSAQTYLREAMILQELADYNRVPALFDAGQDGIGRHFLAMEYLGGPNLEVYVQQRLDGHHRLASAEALSLVYRVGIQVAKILVELHARDIICCDLKANNLVVVKGCLYLIDLGQAHSSAIPGLPSRIERCGTWGYSAPELHGEEDVTPTAASDIYSLGAILHWLLTGCNPVGNKPWPWCFHPYLPESTPPALKWLILAMVERQAEHRPPLAYVQQVLRVLGGYDGSNS